VKSVTWTQLLANKEVQRYKTSKNELDKLRAVIRRDLADASLGGPQQTDVSLPPTMQHSKLQKWRLRAPVMASSGAGHHRISFDVVKLAIGKAADPHSDYFDKCRRKRNVIDYDDAFVATETEAREILTKAKEFVEVVERWIRKNHPSLEA
jgi:hypothetical protein